MRLEPVHCNQRSHHNEKPLLPQLETTQVHHQRPSTAQNKFFGFFKNSRKFQRSKLEFATHQQLFIQHLHCIGHYQYSAMLCYAKSLQSCPTLCDPIDGCPRPWDSPGKNTGVGCHFLLQCMKVKSESEVTQSCPTLSDPMDCSLPGSSIHGIFQARVLEWGAIAFSVPVL